MTGVKYSMENGVTFGICVGDNPTYLTKVVESIENIRDLTANNYEIIFMGEEGVEWYSHNFDAVKAVCKWSSVDLGLCAKKNWIAKAAKFDNVCIIHDYYQFQPNWYEAMRNYPNPAWELMLCPVKTLEGHRSADWLVSPMIMDDMLEKRPDMAANLMAIAPHENGPKYVSGLPYDVTNMSHIQYVSGGYVLAKKKVFMEVPMNNKLDWGDAEDVEWSNRLNHNGVVFSMNTETEMKILKPNKWHCYQMSDEFLEVLKQEYGIWKQL